MVPADRRAHGHPAGWVPGPRYRRAAPSIVVAQTSASIQLHVHRAAHAPAADGHRAARRGRARARARDDPLLDRRRVRQAGAHAVLLPHRTPPPAALQTRASSRRRYSPTLPRTRRRARRSRRCGTRRRDADTASQRNLLAARVLLFRGVDGWTHS